MPTDDETLWQDAAGLYRLRLYVAGATANSLRAIARIKSVCEERLRGRYHLEVVDIYQQPEAAKREQIFATPTLVKYQPEPQRCLIGDMTKTEKLLAGLDLYPE